MESLESRYFPNEKHWKLHNSQQPELNPLRGITPKGDFFMDSNGTLKEEPTIVSKFMPLQAVLLITQQAVEEKQAEPEKKSLGFVPSLILAGILIALGWWITFGWTVQ